MEFGKQFCKDKTLCGFYLHGFCKPTDIHFSLRCEKSCELRIPPDHGAFLGEHGLDFDVEVFSRNRHMDLCQGCGRELEIDELFAGDGLDPCGKIDFQGIAPFFREHKFEPLGKGFQQGGLSIQGQGGDSNILKIQSKLPPLFLEG